MKTLVCWLGFAMLPLAPACSSAPAAPPAASAADAADASSTRPDPEKARSHLVKHVQYPADRRKILDACADTPEFTEAEKRWFETHLPEGVYESADQAISALSL